MTRMRGKFTQALGAGALGLLIWLPGCGLLTPSTKAGEQHSAFDVAEDRKPTEKTLYAMARLLIDQRRYAQAETVLVQVIHDQPEMAEAYGTLGMVELRLGKHAEAMKAFDKGLEVAPNEPVLLNNAGMCCVVEKQYAPALALFQRAVEADGRTARYRANLAMALAMNGRYDEALECYQQVIPAADAHHNLGLLCTLRGDSERATAEFKAERLPAGSAAAAPPRAEAPAIAAKSDPAGSANMPLDPVGAPMIHEEANR